MLRGPMDDELHRRSWFEDLHEVQGDDPFEGSREELKKRFPVSYKCSFCIPSKSRDT
jgi:hypothetical protein